MSLSISSFIRQSSVVALIAVCCSCRNSPVTDLKDYVAYLQPVPAAEQKTGKTDSEIRFWSKRLKINPDDITAQNKIAGLLGYRFNFSGDINDLYRADSLYAIVNRINSKSSSVTFRALAVNAMTKRAFEQAERYIDSALALGDEKYAALLVDFDVAMELGNYARADNVLRLLGDKKNVDCLVRKAMYQEQVTGNIPSAIELMEQALKETKDIDNKSTYCQLGCALAKLYGCDKQYVRCYQSYLDVLFKDPQYDDALKGIAWLSFSHDVNTTAAKQIVNFLVSQQSLPVYQWMLAQIACYEKDTVSVRKHVRAFIQQTNDSLYGNMYNNYLFTIYADILPDTARAMEIAKKETRDHPCPASYDLLAWACFRTGNYPNALHIAKTYVENHCFEPGAWYHTGMIYKAAGDAKAAKRYLLKAKDRGFELGPVAVREINNVLDGF